MEKAYIDKLLTIPEISSYEEQAVDTVVGVINRAKEKLGIRMNLGQLAQSRDFANQVKVSLTPIVAPLAINCEKFIADTIERKWNLTDALMYVLKYMGGSKDETSQFYYYEAIFSQPTVSYPIPQATVSVFFRLEDKHIEPPETLGVPMLMFRIEGQHTDHDVRYVALTVDWILAVIQMKIKLFKRIEEIRLM